MAPKRDLVGQKFGRLTVIADSGDRSGGNIVWECQCDCGASRRVPTSALRTGNTRSCGCLMRETAAENGRRKLHNLVGQRFGRLTVIADSGERPHGRVLWDCQCDCGASHRVITDALTSGNTRSCGCLAREQRPNFRDLTGQRFGRLTVIAEAEERRGHEIMWECLCDCGAVKLIRGYNLRAGLTRSCGCLRDEVARTSNTKHGMTGTPEYHLLMEAKKRASRFGLPFTLTLEDIHIPDVCPVLGIPLIQGSTIQSDNSPSLDRLRPEDGYTKGNVVVLSFLANRIKTNATGAQVRAVADWMESLHL